METSRPVVVKRMPERLNQKQARTFLREIQPLLNTDRPQLVFDCSLIRQMDAAGVDMLLHCMAEIMKRDGELKLAAVSPQASVVLELTRTDRLFEVFETSGDAVRSFYRFLPNAMKNQPMLVPKMEKPEKSEKPETAVPIPINGDTAGGDRAPMAA